MSYQIYTPALVHRVVERTFPDVDPHDVERVLEVYDDRRNKEEVWIAGLRICNGSLRELGRLMKRARKRPADLLNRAQSPRLLAEGEEFARDEANRDAVARLTEADLREYFEWLFDNAADAEAAYHREHAERQLLLDSGDLKIELSWKLPPCGKSIDEEVRLRDFVDRVNDTLVVSGLGVMSSFGALAPNDHYSLLVFGKSDDESVRALFEAVKQACSRLQLPPGSFMKATLDDGTELRHEFRGA